MTVGLRLNSYESKLWFSLKLNLFLTGQHDPSFMKPFIHSFLYLVKKYSLNIHDMLHSILSPWEKKKGYKIPGLGGREGLLKSNIMVRERLTKKKHTLM